MSPQSQPAGATGPGGERRLLAYGLLAAGLLACFLTANVTNGYILEHWRRPFFLIQNWSVRPADSLYGYGPEDYLRFSIGAMKRAVFCGGLAMLLWLMRDAFTPLKAGLADRSLWRNLGMGLALASLFLLVIRPAGHGLIYAKLSLDPFMQEPTYWYRRILLIELANIFQLTGVMYTVFFWMVTVAVLALVSLYLKSKGLVLSWLELASLYTTGLIGATLGLPGLPEILVLGLALLAVMDFDRRGHSGLVQPICLGLALLTHESAAAVAFTALAMFYFDRRFAVTAALILAAYVVTWMIPFGFDAHAAFAAGTMVGGASTLAAFPTYYPLAILAALTALKLLLVPTAMGAVQLLRSGDYRRAAFIAAPLAGGAMLTLFASDYSRMVSFGTIGMLAALPVALPGMSANWRRALAVGNLLFPTILISAHSGARFYDGLYGLILGRLL